MSDRRMKGVANVDDIKELTLEQAKSKRKWYLTTVHVLNL